MNNFHSTSLSELAWYASLTMLFRYLAILSLVMYNLMEPILQTCPQSSSYVLKGVSVSLQYCYNYYQLISNHLRFNIHIIYSIFFLFFALVQLDKRGKRQINEI